MVNLTSQILPLVSSFKSLVSSTISSWFWQDLSGSSALSFSSASTGSGDNTSVEFVSSIVLESLWKLWIQLNTDYCGFSRVSHPRSKVSNLIYALFDSSALFTRNIFCGKISLIGPEKSFANSTWLIGT